MYFDFTKKPNFEELEENNKLLEYTNRLEKLIEDFQATCYVNEQKLLRTAPNIPFHLNGNNKSNIEKYKMLCEYVSDIKILESNKEYLKALKERKTELNEYLKEVVKKLRDNLKL